MSISNSIYVIMGPTGAGKTDLLARYLNQKEIIFEVISVDSRQIYKNMPIGTAMPSKEIRDRIPHHLVEILEPSQYYSAGKFVKDVEFHLQEIFKRGRIPVLCGGTGFYFKAFRRGMFEAQSLENKKEEIRNQLQRMNQKERRELLKKIDPESLTTIPDELKEGKVHPNDSYRIFRSLELYFLTGKTLRLHYKEWKTKQKKHRNYQGIFIVPEKKIWEKKLYIRARMMIQNGFIDEAIEIYRKYGEECPAFKTPGYREVISMYKNGYSINKEEMVEKLFLSHRQYGRYQFKWFKKEDSLPWVSIQEAEKFFQKILMVIRNN